MQHADDLFKRGINVLEDSSNWDWDESQQMTVSTSPSSFLIFIYTVLSVFTDKPDTNPNNITNTFAKPSFQNYAKKALMYLVDAFFLPF